MEVSAISPFKNQFFTACPKKDSHIKIPEQIKDGKNKLTLALIGLGIAAAATSITTAVKSGKLPSSIKYIKGKGFETIKNYTDIHGNNISKTFSGNIRSEITTKKPDGTVVKEVFDKNGARMVVKVITRSKDIFVSYFKKGKKKYTFIKKKI